MCKLYMLSMYVRALDALLPTPQVMLPEAQLPDKKGAGEQQLKWRHPMLRWHHPI